MTEEMKETSEEQEHPLQEEVKREDKPEVEDVEEGLEDIEEFEANNEADVSSSSKVYWFISSGLVLVLLLLLVGSYRVFPLTEKLQGTWQGADDVPYQFEIKGQQGMFVAENFNNVKGARFEMRTTLEGVGPDQYQGTQTNVFLLLDKQKISEEIWGTLKKQKQLYQVKEETNKRILLQYTKEAVKQAFGVEQLDTSFRFQITGWTYGIQPKQIRFQNEAFATNGMYFNRK